MLLAMAGGGVTAWSSCLTGLTCLLFETAGVPQFSRVSHPPVAVKEQPQ
jgi:hypothetical protein